MLHNINTVFIVFTFDNAWGSCPSGKNTGLALPALWEDKMAMGGERPSICSGRERACLRVGSVNANGLKALGKRRGYIECFKRGRLDIMGIQETQTKGCGVMDCMMGSESEVWEGMQGMVWSK